MSAMVRIKNAKGDYVEARALLDTCATAHFISEDFARKLKLPLKPCSTLVGAINEMNTVSKGIIELSFCSLHSQRKKTLSFLTVPKITDLAPDEPFPRESIEIPKNIRLADPLFHIPRPVDILIGSGATLSLLSVGQIDLSQNDCDLLLQKTQLGWVVAGGLTPNADESSVSCNLIELAEQMSRFWRVEDLENLPAKSIEENQCEAHYIKNTRRDSSGRYIVRLPFRENARELGESRFIALQRFRSFMNRLNTDSSLKAEYEQVMKEYLLLGHMSLAKEDISSGYYMPQLAVVKKSSATTKLRVVFDASAKTSKGASLNDNLLVGPTIQDSLFRQLVRFRSHAYVITADIEKMYRQVWIHPEDRRFQKIFWNEKGNIRAYELNTVTFGVSSASYLAIRTIHQLVHDEGADFPLASKILKRDLYVDDLLTGASTTDEILKIRDETIQLLKRGGFNIRQWASNHRHALDDIEEKVLGSDHATEKDPASKTLGLRWNSRQDSLSYTTKPVKSSERMTKRSVLSEIAKIFDPLGLLGPIILAAKVIMQKCWAERIEWDESMPQSLHRAWKIFAEQLYLIADVKIDRHISLRNPSRIEIHGFCDASKVGYGACLYLRSTDRYGNLLIRLICAKSRVAPLKEMTIPRLELCGALILVRLYSEVREALDISMHGTFFWCDSMIVLHWIKKSTQDLKLFEANRVAEIQALRNQAEWRYVKSADNPADALSRGQTPADFLKNATWFAGPKWLHENQTEWPENPELLMTDLPGLKKSSCFMANLNRCEILNKFSSFSRLTYVIAYILRWRYRVNPFKGSISVEEKRGAETKIISLVQREQFSEEIARVQGDRETKSARLKALSPFIDEDGLLRVGGRLRKADISASRKHPILLPSRHYVTDLIIRECHEREFHAGIQSTLYALRHRYWILDGKNQVRKVIKNCPRCIRYLPTSLHTRMADLPNSRITEAEVFSRVGIDFFGPIYVKEKKFRNRNRIKTYGCVFICMVTKAIHIELVTDMTTDGFLGALRRFVARRGFPTDIYSDNGTNFVGAHSQFRELFVLIQSDEFKRRTYDYALDKNIVWHFNPPQSPHFGGIWEAAVKSFKHHFRRVVGDSLFTFEEINTFSTEIEAILNSRPLTALSSDPNDPQALTPAHFMIGRSLRLIPEDNFSCVPDNRLSSWKRISKARQHFWKKWRTEYLGELQKRQKWLERKEILKLDSIVILIDKNLPCGRWQLGRIVEMHPGDDGLVRVVTVRTTTGDYKRNVTTLCPLPTEA